MGSVCCVAAKDRTIPSRIGAETFHSNAIYSWGIHGNRQGQSMSEIDGELHEIPSRIIKHRNMKMKGSLCFEAGDCSGGERSLENITSNTSQNSPVMDEIDTFSTVRNSAKSSSLMASPEVRAPCVPKLSFSMPSTPCLHAPVPFHPRPCTHRPPRQAHRSPNANSVSDGSRRSLGPSDPNEASHGSSDGWSMRTFTELVASSQRERWSLDSEVSGSPPSSSSSDRRNCGACVRPLSAGFFWAGSGSDVSVAAVLVCGHVYHATCLEAMTPETAKYDPPCPVCTVGEKQVIRMSKKAQKREAADSGPGRIGRVSRNRVVDSFFGAGDSPLPAAASSSGEGVSLRRCDPSSSSSVRRPSSVKPFLRRHFSLGSRQASRPGQDLPPRKGFWSRGGD